MADHWAQGVLTLVAVVILAIYVLFLAKKFGWGAAARPGSRAGWGVARGSGSARLNGPLETLACLPLEAHRSIYVVRVADQVLIVGASEAGLNALGHLPPDAVLPAEPVPSSPRFSDALRAAIGRPNPKSENSGSV